MARFFRCVDNTPVTVGSSGCGEVNDNN